MKFSHHITSRLIFNPVDRINSLGWLIAALFIYTAYFRCQKRSETKIFFNFYNKKILLALDGCY